MDYFAESLEKHYEWQGKIEVCSRTSADSKQALSLAYTPGVAQPCLEIQKNPDECYKLTRRKNLVAVVTDGSAVLGLGDIGPLAAMPVMEGKCVLFKEFAGVDAFPICVDSRDVDEIVNTVRLISGSFGGINLEDISAPRCFEIERRLKEVCDVPIFHDDQHGTAIVTVAALFNACRLTGREISDQRFVLSGAGAAGTAVAKLLLSLSAKDIIMCDSGGAICRSRADLNAEKTEIARLTNPRDVSGSLADAIKNADVFIGVSAAGTLTGEMVRSMNADPVIFAMANPVPEIMPDIALKAGAGVVGTGRSDFPNQINNVLAFPGVFKGALSVLARDITDGMKLAAARAIAECVSHEKLSKDYILPQPFEPGIADKVAAAVAEAAKNEGVAIARE